MESFDLSSENQDQEDLEKDNSKEIAQIEEQRVLSDANFIKGGAHYIVNPDGSKRLDITDKQLGDLKKEFLEPSKEQSLEVWKQIKIGTFKTTEELQAAVSMNGNISTDAKKMFSNRVRKLEIVPSEEVVNLVRIKVKNLGFPRGGYADEINKKAEEEGLALCPDETGPQLFLQGSDVSEGERLSIAMRPIEIRPPSWGMPCIFQIKIREGSLMLGTRSGIARERYDPEDVFIYIKK